MDDELIPTTMNPPRRPVGAEDRSASTGSRKRSDSPSDKKAKFADFPEVGDALEDCRLVAELGSGASGQAFLAQQEALADRPIVLKITTAAAREEHLNLARLQHTHIMPLYWTSTLPYRGLHVLAMPYLARTTLAGLLQRLEKFPRETWSGQQVFEILHDDEALMPVRIAVEAQPAEVLQRSTWVPFVVRMGQTLAEALAYAHQRDLLHLDLKPSNILITPDGQPILLDLDVARQPIPAGTTFLPWLGGTVAFMSPEQRAAMEALTNHQPTPCAVDGRSDMYSLGLVLYHALGGQCDAKHRPDPDSLCRMNPHVSRGLADIVARCLAEKPDDRYPDCNALAEDLRRHLHDLPLRGVRNRWPERWRKWRRRRPLALPVVLLVLGFCLTAGVAGFHFHQTNEDRRRQAETALLDGQEFQRQGQHDAAIRRFLAGKELAEQTLGIGHLQTQLDRRLLLAQRLQKADELNKLVHQLRFYALQDHTPRRMQHVLEAASRKIWADRELLTDQSYGKLELAAERNIRAQLQELTLLWSDLQIRLAPPTHTESVRGEVRKVLAEAERMFGPSLGLSLAQAKHLDLPFDPRQAREAWEFCALGRLALEQGQDADAARFMQAALDREPLGFVANFYFGVCALRQKRHDQAVQALSFCAGQNPCAECFLLRGQAHASLGNAGLALKDFNCALEKNPELGIAYQNRGNLHRDMGRPADAENDWQIARKLSE